MSGERVAGEVERLEKEIRRDWRIGMGLIAVWILGVVGFMVWAWRYQAQGFYVVPGCKTVGYALAWDKKRSEYVCVKVAK